MSLRWHSVVIACHDVAAQARWWADILDWRIVSEAADEVSWVVLAHPEGNEFCVLSPRER
jgi:catechol 2,3-dioxygenase-like lactoylglutathione lyase family enzyme